MAVTPERPPTCTGARRSVVDPSPSCPLVLLPQAQTVPSLFKASEWAPPAETAVTPANPEMSAGVVAPRPDGSIAFLKEGVGRRRNLYGPAGIEIEPFPVVSLEID